MHQMHSGMLMISQMLLSMLTELFMINIEESPLLLKMREIFYSVMVGTYRRI